MLEIAGARVRLNLLESRFNRIKKGLILAVHPFPAHDSGKALRNYSARFCERQKKMNLTGSVNREDTPIPPSGPSPSSTRRAAAVSRSGPEFNLSVYSRSF